MTIPFQTNPPLIYLIIRIEKGGLARLTNASTTGVRLIATILQYYGRSPTVWCW